MAAEGFPDLLPLRISHEADAVEADIKRLTIDLFEDNLRASERELNVYGMPHLGSLALLERNVTGDGLALFRRDDVEAMRYLFKAWRARNPKRGLHFLKTYLQLLFPNNWTAVQLWHDANVSYPNGLQETEAPGRYLTSRVQVTIGANTAFEVLPVIGALRSVMPARLLFQLSLLAPDANQTVSLAHALGSVQTAQFTGTCGPTP